MSFSLDLSRAIKKAKGKQELVVKKVMLEAFSKVVMKSPVLSGRFKGNWQASIGTYSKTPIETIDRDGSATISKIKSSIASMSLNGQTIYLCNALPYAVRLERGWSKQAPMGMVRLTLAEITAHYGA